MHRTGSSSSAVEAAAPSTSGATTSSSCALCLDLLRFPVTLLCGHSLCKPCILSRNKENGGARISMECPSCQQHTVAASEADLKINAVLQSVVEIMRGEQVPRTPCMRCEAVEATVDCPECNAKFCSSCADLVHVGQLRAHRIAYNATAVHAVNKPPYCSQLGHEDYRTDLFCVDCSTMLCVVCSQVSPLHRSHVVVPLSEAADIEKGKLLQTLQSAQRFRQELKHALSIVDDAIERNQTHTSMEMAAFDRQVAQLLQRIQEKRVALMDNCKLISEAELANLRRVRQQIVALAASLNESVASSQRALAMDTSAAILRGCVDMAAQLARTEPVLIPETHVPTFQNVSQAVASIALAVDSLSVALSSNTDVDAQIVAASSVFQPKGFQFAKSTYNDLIISNRGQSVASRPGAPWETALCSELLSSGVVHFEVAVQQYTPINGHNIIVGFVFDGAYELCEVIGEDTHSVGFDLGRGTKCVGGDYFLPYAADAACGQGDVVGVKIDFDQRLISFYKNGRPLGVAFTGVSKPCYAAVSLCDAQKVALMFPMRKPL